MRCPECGQEQVFWLTPQVEMVECPICGKRRPAALWGTSGSALKKALRQRRTQPAVEAARRRVRDRTG